MSVTASPSPDVTPEPLQMLGFTAVTPVTAALAAAVTPEPLQMLGCTVVTPVTAENHSAFERRISLWLTHNPPTQHDATICPYCGQPNGEIGRDTIATANGTWLHGACHVEWLKQRRQLAIAEIHTNQTRH